MAYLEFHNYKQEAYARSIARGGGVDRSVTVISTLKDRTPLAQPQELDEGQFKWGKPSSFSWGRDSQDFNEGVIPSTSWEFNLDPEGPQNPDPDQPEDELAPLIEEWTETERKETEVRIDGPDGAYIDFMRIDEVTFKLPNLPDGREHFVVQKFKTAGDAISPSPPGAGSGGSGATGAIGVGTGGIIRDPNGPGTI